MRNAIFLIFIGSLTVNCSGGLQTNTSRHLNAKEIQIPTELASTQTTIIHKAIWSADHSAFIDDKTVLTFELITEGTAWVLYDDNLVWPGIFYAGREEITLRSGSKIKIESSSENELFYSLELL